MDRKNKLMLAAAIGATAILIASTAVRCTAARTAETEGPADSAAYQAAEQEKTKEEGAGMDEDAAMKAMDVLRSHAWQAEGSPSSTIEFRDGSFVEADSSGVKVTAIEVTGAHEDDDHASIDVTMTREGVGTFQSVIAVDGREGSLAVTSDGFANTSVYVQGSGAKGPVAVEGVCEPYKSLIDGKEDELAAAVASFCRGRVPTATRAAFDGEVYLDIPGGRVTATFHCDDKASTILSVAYANGEFTVIG